MKKRVWHKYTTSLNNKGRIKETEWKGKGAELQKWSAQIICAVSLSSLAPSTSTRAGVLAEILVCDIVKDTRDMGAVGGGVMLSLTGMGKYGLSTRNLKR